MPSVAEGRGRAWRHDHDLCHWQWPRSYPPGPPGRSSPRPRSLSQPRGAAAVPTHRLARRRRAAARTAPCADRWPRRQLRRQHPTKTTRATEDTTREAGRAARSPDPQTGSAAPPAARAPAARPGASASARLRTWGHGQHQHQRQQRCVGNAAAALRRGCSNTRRDVSRAGRGARARKVRIELRRVVLEGSRALCALAAPRRQGQGARGCTGGPPLPRPSPTPRICESAAAAAAAVQHLCHVNTEHDSGDHWR